MIREALSLRESNKLRSIEYLGVKEEKAILKVSTPSIADSKRNTEEFFSAKATPSLIIWIDENLYKITVPNFKKLYHYIQLQENKRFRYERWTIITQDPSGNESEKKIRIQENGYNVFIFYFRSDGIRPFSPNIKRDRNHRDGLKYKKLWLELMNHIE
ncbi:hypothetical protein [Leptospira mayottensis]|uniref:hypothetical protein n=1 Tax=Leptospira mayottensis TaxID=1137606 RepID=UPI0002BEFF0F|nr:hypothetical protein [Leptospira mayottensis]AXR60460.1 hypothetical protein DQM68_06915 [Leptospira mayottensis]AZQ03108.1 hypothetical protein LEP1GSC190_14770 [Leptospira mayottensis 200901116]TGN09171.1 hypothetical protein EHR03_08025 [Leptospira mayottensis]